MCSIYAALLYHLDARPAAIYEADQTLRRIFIRSRRRGRDGSGYEVSAASGAYASKAVGRESAEDHKPPQLPSYQSSVTVIGNMRAEPTTEYVADKNREDQQPYQCGPWTIVHNGTIANDKAMRTNLLPTTIDSAALAEGLHQSIPDSVEDPYQVWKMFYAFCGTIKGSYAFIARNRAFPDRLFIAANYRPLWYAYDEHGTYFTSARGNFPSGMRPQMLPPYTAAVVVAPDKLGDAPTVSVMALREGPNNKALVICSGGMDSVVAATYVKEVLGHDIELIHFQYGSRAEGPEVKAVQAVADSLGVKVTFFPLPIYKPSDSPLLQADSTIAGGEEGAEFAHEWVPARNLVLLSVATAYAEANGFETLVLGNNLEEAGAYPDNEPEFIDRFNDLLDFAVGDGKQLQVIMPVGNMMKHEIVKMGHDINAPLDLTWSCYRAGEKHCGTCGPCYMRRTAFKINNLAEVIEYDT